MALQSETDKGNQSKTDKGNLHNNQPFGGRPWRNPRAEERASEISLVQKPPCLLGMKVGVGDGCSIGLCQPTGFTSIQVGASTGSGIGNGTQCSLGAGPLESRVPLPASKRTRCFSNWKKGSDGAKTTLQSGPVLVGIGSYWPFLAQFWSFFVILTGFRSFS